MVLFRGHNWIYLEIDAIGTAAWVSSFDGAILRAERSAEGFRARASATLTGAFDGVRSSVDALSAAVARSDNEIAEALGNAGAAVERVSDAFEGTETAARGAGGAARGAGKTAAEASAALSAAAGAMDEAGAAALTGWQAATAALAEYADTARAIGGDVGQSLVGAFRSAETAVGEFVRSGKLDFRDLVTSMIADLAQLGARRFLLGPIANALTCDAALGDARCGVDLEAPAFKGTGIVTAASGDRGFTASGLDGFKAGWFHHGILDWTGGASAGRRAEVAGHAHEDGIVTVTLLEATVRPITPGDTFAVRAGCDKRIATCAAKFGNVANFQGFPHIPGADAVIRYATRHGGHEGAVL